MKHIAVLAAALLASTAATHAAPSTFEVRVVGAGRPMILIPGLACPGEVWEPTVDQLHKRYACHVLSLAGFGGRPARPVEGPLLAAVREELAAYILEQKLERPVIVGHSLGGFVALDLAVRHPELPGHIVAVDSLPFILGVMQPGATVDDAKQAAASTAAAFSGMDAAAYARMIRGGPNGSTMAAGEADLERIIAWGLASDPATVARAMTELYTTDLRADLKHIQAPTLALAAWVGYAPYSSHETVDRIYGEQYACLDGVRINITDTARHFIMMDDLPWMLARIEAFLAETPVAAR